MPPARSQRPGGSRSSTVELSVGRPDLRRQHAGCRLHTRQRAAHRAGPGAARPRGQHPLGEHLAACLLRGGVGLHRQAADEGEREGDPQGDRRRCRGEAARPGPDVGHGQEAAGREQRGEDRSVACRGHRASTGPGRPTATMSTSTTKNDAAAAASPLRGVGRRTEEDPARQEAETEQHAHRPDAPGLDGGLGERAVGWIRAARRPAIQAARQAVTRPTPTAITAGSGPITRLAVSAPMPRRWSWWKRNDPSNAPGHQSHQAGGQRDRRPPPAAAAGSGGAWRRPREAAPAPGRAAAPTARAWRRRRRPAAPRTRRRRRRAR